MDSPWPTKVGSLCKTCGKEPSVRVVPVTGMPVSAGRGARCLAEYAEPFSALRQHVAFGAVNGIRDVVDYENWLDTVWTFVDDQYVVLREALARYPITPEEVERQRSWQRSWKQAARSAKKTAQP